MSVHQWSGQLDAVLIVIESKRQVECEIIEIFRVELPVFKLNNIIPHWTLETCWASVRNQVEFESIRSCDCVFDDESLLRIVKSSFV